MEAIPLKQEAEQVLKTLEQTPAQAICAQDAPQWEAWRTRVGFSLALPAKPEHPSPPQEPVFDEPPREDDPSYAVELTTLDKLLASRRMKKQQAALHRFERDRKAWNDDRKHGLALYEFAKKKYAEQCASLESTHQAALNDWKGEFEVFLRNLVQNNVNGQTRP